ncbi:MAG: hypothetical protein ACK559_24170, partial [bacterium]
SFACSVWSVASSDGSTSRRGDAASAGLPIGASDRADPGQEVHDLVERRLRRQEGADVAAQVGQGTLRLPDVLLNPLDVRLHARQPVAQRGHVLVVAAVLLVHHQLVDELEEHGHDRPAGEAGSGVTEHGEALHAPPPRLLRQLANGRRRPHPAGVVAGLVRRAGIVAAVPRTEVLAPLGIVPPDLHVGVAEPD